jgi:hypothetical protein
MTDAKWKPEDYFVNFPDVLPFEGPLEKLPFMHQVDKVCHYVMKVIIPEILRAINADAELSGLVLSLALVDYIAGYYSGKETSGKDYINFLNHYFPEVYKPYSQSIYRDLRNGLMHNLAATNPWHPEKFFFIHRNLPHHLFQEESGRVLFSVPIFLEDIRRAWIMYMHDLIEEGSGQELKPNFEKRFKQIGGLGAFMEKIPD